MATESVFISQVFSISPLLHFCNGIRDISGDHYMGIILFKNSQVKTGDGEIFRFEIISVTQKSLQKFLGFFLDIRRLTSSGIGDIEYFDMVVDQSRKHYDYLWIFHIIPTQHQSCGQYSTGCAVNLITHAERYGYLGGFPG